MKIFISIASYQDPLLKATIRSAFKMSDKPENLTFGVCDQSSISIDLNSFEFKNQISYELMAKNHKKNKSGKKKKKGSKKK